MSDYFYPSTQQIEEIAQDRLPVLTMDDPIFSLFPVEDAKDYILRWEQVDNYKGLQSIRGLNGVPANVQRVGGKGFVAKPGVYGEFVNLDEEELTRRREWGTFDQKIDIADLVMKEVEFLLTREIDRMRYVAWTCAVTGTITVLDKDGVILYSDAFALQTFTPAVSWTTYATATPLADLRSVKLLARGHSVDFSSKAKLYVNQTTANALLQNQNSADLFGRRGMYGATLNSLQGTNAVFLENGLPMVEVYDGHYIDNTGTVQLFIPTGKGLLAGVRPNGEPVGTYRRVWNAVNRSPGSYVKIKENEEDIPPHIEVHRGHNGGLVVKYPSALVIMNLF